MSRNNNMNAIMAGGFATGEAGMDAEDAEAATKKKTAYAYPWMAANRPTRNAPWEMTSLNSTERLEKAEAERKAAAYKPVHFWTKTSTDRAHEAERAMQAKEYTYTKPWDVHPDDADRAAEEELNRQMAAIAGVGAHETTCPWKTEEMTEKQKEQLAAYKYTTPYQTAYSEPTSPPKAAKRRIPGQAASTVKPWDYGSQPAPPVGKSSAPVKATYLWDVPETATDASALGIIPSGDPILDDLRYQLKRHGATGLLSLSRKFRIMDDDNDGALNMVEFTKAMTECGIADLSKKAIKHLFRFFDKDDSGTITLNEFLVGVRGVLNPRRKALVKMAFDILDTDKSGTVTVDDIRGLYDATRHPDVLRGTRTIDDVLEEILGHFELGGEAKDGVVTWEEFESYYASISADVDFDDYFELMMRNAWHISGGEGWCANTSNKRVLVTHADGSQTVEEIKHDLGLKAGDKAGIMARLAAQGVDVSGATVNGRGNTDGAKDRQDRQLLELQQRAAEMGLGEAGAGASASARSRASGSGAPPKALSLAAALAQSAVSGGGGSGPVVSSSSSSRAGPAGGYSGAARSVAPAPAPARAPAPVPAPARPYQAPPAVRAALSVVSGGSGAHGSQPPSRGGPAGPGRPRSLADHLG